jgi:hypothetical protein
MRAFCYVIAAVVLLGPHSVMLAAGDEPSPYDGRWTVTLTCPPHNDDDDEDAKGYAHRFPAEVKDGMMRGTHATEGQPGWHFLSGVIGQDGSLRLEGIVNKSEYSVNHAYRGKPYVYRVRAKFETSSGVGQRVGKRKCEFQFRRG